MKGSQFSARGLTSLMTASGFVVMALSGIVAYMVPHGRIAYWTNWSFLGLTKESWAAIHVTTSLLFFGACGFHIYFNWKPLTSYIVSKVHIGLNLKKELAITSAVLVFCVLSAIYHVAPLSYFLDWSESLKGSWVSREYEPPFGRAELLGLDSFCKKMDIPLEKAVVELEAKRINVIDVKEPLQGIAKRNKLSPMRLYMAIKHLEPKPASTSAISVFTPQGVEEKFAGSGIGRKTILEIAESMSLDSSKVMQRLAILKIDARDDEPIKQVAERNGLEPIEFLKAMLIENYGPEK